MHLAGAPAVIEVTPYGATVRCHSCRRRRGGSRSLARFSPRYMAWSASVHSHSRLFRKPIWLGKVSLLSVVSIWKILRCSSSTPAIRWYEWCIAELGGSLKDRECRSVCTLW